MFEPTQHPHRRLNRLTGEWVLVSPHRTQRPWQGQVEAAAAVERPEYDPQCYLCPGNTRANGEVNPQYPSTFAFQNDFSALVPEVPAGAQDGLLVSRAARGECRVICFSPRHDLTLATMDDALRLEVVRLWCTQENELRPKWAYVQIFENRGEAMGASNPHPHGQIWASDFTPTLVDREASQQFSYLGENNRALLTDYVEHELREGTRVVEQNEHWVWLVPFWATWPFEILLLPRRPVATLGELTPHEQEGLATILGLGLGRYDRLFGCPFPYSMGWHTAPWCGEEGWVLHAHFYPPLLRSATVRKFMVGYEMLAESQRDITPEQAAERLRSV